MSFHSLSSTWIIGCGDIGSRVTALYQSSGITTNALVNTQASANRLKNQHDEVIATDLDRCDALAIKRIPTNAQIYYFAPPPVTGTTDPRLAGFLDSLSKHHILPRKIVLISTTGVYGNADGEWVTETTVPAPQTDRALRRLDAEQGLQKWAMQYQVDFIILRVPGIYAQDRLPLTRLKKGLPVVKRAESAITNRIHADDLAMICKIAMTSKISGEIFNASDGHPGRMTDYFNAVADFANLPRPPQISMREAEATLSKGMISYLRESRKISNQKLRDTLEIKFKYPDLLSTLSPADTVPASIKSENP